MRYIFRWIHRLDRMYMGSCMHRMYVCKHDMYMYEMIVEKNWKAFFLIQLWLDWRLCVCMHH